MKIIAFTGMPWSGKSEAVTIAKTMNIPVIRMGDFVWEETKQRGLKLTDENVGKTATEMRDTQGKDIWAQKTLKKLKTSDPTSLVIIDGIRNLEEIEVFKKFLSEDFMLVAIDASQEIRYKRALTRKRIDDSTDISILKQRDQRELRWGIGAVIASADIVISNENGIERFRHHIKELLER